MWQEVGGKCEGMVRGTRVLGKSPKSSQNDDVAVVLSQSSILRYLRYL